MVIFKLFAQFPVDHITQSVVSSLFVLICCIPWLCDWLFRLYNHITYICYLVAHYLFLQWYNWSLWRCFVLLLASFLPPSFLDTYSQSTSSLSCKALCIVMNFLVLRFICWSSSLVHFKNGPEYLTRGQPRYLSLWWNSCYIIWFWVAFLFSWGTPF